MFMFVGTILPFDRISGSGDVVQSVQGIEASLNTILLAGLGLLALVRSEARIKRMRVLKSLHGLRSVIHVIDMHQLTKDPGGAVGRFRADRDFAGAHDQPRRPVALSRLLFGDALADRQAGGAVLAVGQ